MENTPHIRECQVCGTSIQQFSLPICCSCGTRIRDGFRAIDKIKAEAFIEVENAESPAELEMAVAE